MSGYSCVAACRSLKLFRPKLVLQFCNAFCVSLHNEGIVMQKLFTIVRHSSRHRSQGMCMKIMDCVVMGRVLLLLAVVEVLPICPQGENVEGSVNRYMHRMFTLSVHV